MSPSLRAGGAGKGGRVVVLIDIDVDVIMYCVKCGFEIGKTGNET